MSAKNKKTTSNQIYAAYGQALYLAQSMEIGMRIFYWLDKVLPDTPPGKSPRIDFSEDPIPEHNVFSLGGFIRQFRKELMEEGTIDSQTRVIMRKLEQAVAARNYLVHSYWGERTTEFLNNQDRAAMLAELEELKSDFRYHDLLIRQMVLLLLSHYHLEPDEIISDSFQSYIQMSQMPE